MGRNPYVVCDRPAASFIPRRGEYFSCVLEAGHEGECRPGGTCYKHGKYSSEPGRPPKCPHWPKCIEELSAVDKPETEGFALLSLSHREQEVLTQLAKQKDLSEEAVLRQALRMYQLTDMYMSQGYELAFWKPDGEIIRPLRTGPKMAPMPEEE